MLSSLFLPCVLGVFVLVVLFGVVFVRLYCRVSGDGSDRLGGLWCWVP